MKHEIWTELDKQEPCNSYRLDLLGMFKLWDTLPLKLKEEYKKVGLCHDQFGDVLMYKAKPVHVSLITAKIQQ